jgi:hypothetical protein
VEVRPDTHRGYLRGGRFIRPEREEPDVFRTVRGDEGRQNRGFLNVCDKRFFEAEPFWKRAKDRFGR